MDRPIELSYQEITCVATTEPNTSHHIAAPMTLGHMILPCIPLEFTHDVAVAIAEASITMDMSIPPIAAPHPAGHDPSASPENLSHKS